MHLLRNVENLGFAAGNNQALGKARGEYLVLLNNDTVVTSGWLGRLLACADLEPEIGLVGPRSNRVSGDQFVPEAGYHDLADLDRYARDHTRRYAGQISAVRRLVGFCLLFKRSVLEKIGGLDTRFADGNFEDDDFCLRAGIAGFRCCVAHDVFIHHVGGATFHARTDSPWQQAMAASAALFAAKWGFAWPEGTYSIDYEQLLDRPFEPARHYCSLDSRD